MIDAAPRTDSASRVIDASPSDIFDAFADGETLMKWMPPPGMTGRALAYRFTTGGRYRIELTYRDGGGGSGKTTGDSDISNGEFVEIVPNRLIRQTVHFESGDPALAQGMTMQWTFDPAPGGTNVTVTATDVPAAIGEADHVQGLNASLDNLAAFVTG